LHLISAHLKTEPGFGVGRVSSAENAGLFDAHALENHPRLQRRDAMFPRKLILDGGNRRL
jgi:hypothetical protein